MFNTFQDQFTTANKTNFDAQIAMMTALTNKTFEGMEKLIDLNLSLTKASLQESSAAAKLLMTSKDPQEFFAHTQAQSKPAAEKVLAYGREVVSIASHTQAEFTKAAEEQITETNRKVLSMVDEVSKHAPAGSEGAVSALKSIIGNANAGYEQLTKTTKQAVETLETNLNQAVSQMVSSVEKATPKAKKSA